MEPVANLAICEFRVRVIPLGQRGRKIRVHQKKKGERAEPGLSWGNEDLLRKTRMG